jgi:anti-sigma factor ChrR (cupin superfamily)
MLEAIVRRVRVTHPAPESLIPFALGGGDSAVAGHVAACVTCQAEIERLQDAGGLLRSTASLERRIRTPACLDELVVADFVDGRLSAGDRVTVVAHLSTCAHCRSVLKATSRVIADPGTTTVRPPSRRWAAPLGLAAAAALLLLLVPRGADENPSQGLREPTVTSTNAPSPIAPAPGESVARVDRLVWSSVPGAERYRVRLYDREGSTLWTRETSDTSVALPDSITFHPRVPYFWRVEAQAEWMRWTASDLVSFQVVGSRR